jgi:hypothetical protein
MLPASAPLDDPLAASSVLPLPEPLAPLDAPPSEPLAPPLAEELAPLPLDALLGDPLVLPLDAPLPTLPLELEPDVAEPLPEPMGGAFVPDVPQAHVATAKQIRMGLLDFMVRSPPCSSSSDTPHDGEVDCLLLSMRRCAPASTASRIWFREMNEAGARRRVRRRAQDR